MRKIKFKNEETFWVVFMVFALTILEIVSYLNTGHFFIPCRYCAPTDLGI